jgi:hypothetical protein
MWRRWVGVVVVGVGLSACSRGNDGADTSVETEASAPASLGTETSAPGVPSPLDDVQVFDDLSQQHVDTPVQYEQTPPVGGPHAPPPLWQNCAFYDSAVPSEHAVHSMEHGAVWVTYSPDLPEADRAELAELADDYVLVSAYEGLPSPVVASAWGRQLQLIGVADPGLEAFIDQFANGPQSPEPGAPCSGGTSSLILGEEE